MKLALAPLVLLLISNSSLALEILTHDGHNHGQAVSEYQPAMDPHSHHHDALAVGDHQHGSLQHGGHPGTAADNGEDDCICDEICCLTTADFGIGASGDHFPEAVAADRRPSARYTSISLDLLLPPPNH